MRARGAAGLLHPLIAYRGLCSATHGHSACSAGAASVTECMTRTNGSPAAAWKRNRVARFSSIGTYHATSPTASHVLEEWRLRLEHIENGTTDVSARISDAPRVDESALFATSDLHLAEIDTYGFDMDYTLATYSEHLHQWLYAAALRVLVEDMKYPHAILQQLEYDPSFPCRGVFFDPNHGTLVKIDASQHVEAATRGKRVLSRDEIRRHYPGAHVRYDNLTSMRMMADLFCYSEVCLLSDLIHWLSDRGLSFDSGHVYHDVMAAISTVHTSGALYAAVLADPGRFVMDEPLLRPYLERLRAHGKHRFILTNSPFDFVNGVLTHMLGASWRELFDLVVCQADKPHFYAGSRPFRRYKNGCVDWSPVNRLLGDSDTNVFVGGNLLSFVQMTGFERVLFMGDHVESDMREPRRFGWRTAMVLSELGRDVHVNNSSEYRTCLSRLLEAKDFVTNIYDCKSTLHAYDKEVVYARMVAEMDDTQQRMRTMFGSSFGSVFSSGTQSSLFGLRVYRWTDLYTSKLVNFMAYNSDSYLAPRGTTKTLTHDVRAVM